MLEQHSFFRNSSYKIFTLLFAIVVVVFTILKIQTIATPYFWDELGVYVPGALKMMDNGTIGLLPSSLEPLYSRGHPLLFVFSQASWFHLVGDTPAAGHSFSIMLAVATLIVFYYCARDLFGNKIAFVSSALLAVQPMFFAMAGVILPEMMLTLFTIPAIWAIVKNRWVIFAITGSLAMMTKESAIIIPPLAMLVIFVDSLLEKRVFSLRNISRYILAAVPFMIYGLFLIIQKKQNGWYFFPEHMGYLRLDASLIEQLWIIARDTLLEQGRTLPGIFIIAVGVIVNLRRNAFRRTINIFILFVLACIAFADLNFYLSRYMLYALPFVVLGGVYGAQFLFLKMQTKWQTTALGTFIAVTAITSFLSMDTGKFEDTADMSYLHLVQTKQEAISWLEQQPWKDSVIEANFPIFQALSDMRNGYLSVKPFSISVNYEKRAPYGLWFHFKEDENIVWDGRPYTIIKRWKCLMLLSVQLNPDHT
ncbi:MAG TPA: glycosyltransferase family 39 protein [Flavipsychrobacter sp.]|nr:glycosyltransferase family 39 protein [Flavipsychrobacter sp.]